MDSNRNTGNFMVRIICWSIVALLLVCVLVWGILFNSVTGWVGDLFRNGFNSIEIDNPAILGSYEFSGEGEITVPAQGISNINVDWVSGRIVVRIYGGDDIKFSETATRAISSAEQLRYEISNGTLRIMFFPSGVHYSVRNLSKKLELYIPESLASSFTGLRIDSVSGDIDIASLRLERLNIDSTSGAIKLTSLEAKNVKINSISGSANLDQVVADEIGIDTTSGYIKGVGVVADKLRCNSISGSISFSGTFEDIKSDSTSGSIEFMASDCPNLFNASSISGSVKLYIPDNNGFTVSFDSISGKLSSDFPLMLDGRKSVYGNGSARFDVSTTSGSFKIFQNNSK